MGKGIAVAIKHAIRILDAWLPAKIRYDRVPGLSVGIVHNGKFIYKRGFGFADVESRMPATPMTRYRIASISKTFTAVAVLQLVEKGRLNLDDRVVKYLPWFRLKSGGADSNNITVRQILSHTAGVSRDGSTPHWTTDDFPDLEGIKKSISSKVIVYENLTRFKYSNLGFALLGEIIAEITAMSYEQYVSRHIIQKLKLENTTPDLTKEDNSLLARGYWRSIPNRRRESFQHVRTKAYSPAAGFISNVVDLSRYLSALSLKRREENSLISRESKKEIMREHWKTTKEGDSYGLGFEIWRIKKRKVIGHGGGFAGFATLIALDLEDDIGVVALANASDASVGSINIGIFETIYALAEGKAKYTKGKKLQDNKSYEGIYRSRWEDKVVVATGANLVAFDSETDAPLKNGALLRPCGRNKFIIEPESNFDSAGELAKFIFEGGEKRARRLIWGSTPLARIEKQGRF